jgi:hypothetical protein
LAHIGSGEVTLSPSESVTSCQWVTKGVTICYPLGKSQRAQIDAYAASLLVVSTSSVNVAHLVKGDNLPRSR